VLMQAEDGCIAVVGWGTPTRYTTNLRHHWLGCWPLMSETTEYTK
jgi:hypothetical protein